MDLENTYAKYSYVEHDTNLRFYEERVDGEVDTNTQRTYSRDLN